MISQLSIRNINSMEEVKVKVEQVHNPRIKHILKNYQESAELSLCGPTKHKDILGSHDMHDANNTTSEFSKQNTGVTGIVTRRQYDCIEQEHGLRAMIVYRCDDVYVNDVHDAQLPTIISGHTVFENGQTSVSAEDWQHGQRRADPPMHAMSVKMSIATTKPLLRKALATAPLFFSVADSTHERSRGETKTEKATLEGKRIACFSVGGEKRLCLPQVLNVVLDGVDPRDIMVACERLRVYFPQCSDAQLECLKRDGILAPNVHSCGLIKQSDAERLCAVLLIPKDHKSGIVRHGAVNGDIKRSESVSPWNQSVTNSEMSVGMFDDSPDTFLVYHECFGGARGTLSPRLYSYEDAKCICCCTCRDVFSPSQFVCHSHSSIEDFMCHWGFDSANWRVYLMLSHDQSGVVEGSVGSALQRALDDIKIRFECTGSKKHHEVVSADGSKRRRCDVTVSETGDKWVPANDSVPWSTCQSILREVSAPHKRKTHMLPAYLYTGPPVLVDPDHVVPCTDIHRFDDCSVPPNVSLAPEIYEKQREKYEVDVDERNNRVHDDVKAKDAGRHHEEILAVVDGADRDVKPQIRQLLLKRDDCHGDCSSTSSSPSATPMLSPCTFDATERAETSDTESVMSERALYENSAPIMQQMSSDMQTKFALLKFALEGRARGSDDVGQRLVTDFVAIQNRQLDTMKSLMMTQRALEQELSYVLSSTNRRLTEAAGVQARQQQQLDAQQALLRDAATENRALKAQIEALNGTGGPVINNNNNHVLTKEVSEYREQAERLKRKLRLVEECNDRLRLEVTELRRMQQRSAWPTR